MTDQPTTPPIEDLFDRIVQIAKPKARSKSTWTDIHLPELSHRLILDLNLKPPAEIGATAVQDPFTPTPDLTSTAPIEIIYLGNSMLERLKSTGSETRLSQCTASWNAGCGGDKNENVLFRQELGMFDILCNNCKDIKAWILTSGTNNLHPKRPFKKSDVESWTLLGEACLRIAPQSIVLACDMFYRTDVKRSIIDESNKMLEDVVKSVNERIGEEKVRWIEARALISEDMLLDHVHLDKKGYEVWDEVLWPLVTDFLGQTEEEHVDVKNEGEKARVAEGEA